MVAARLFLILFFLCSEGGAALLAKKSPMKPKKPKKEAVLSAGEEKSDEAILSALQGQGLGACYLKLPTENVCLPGLTERKCVETARERSPAICYFNEGELECTPQSTPGLGQLCQGTCVRDSGEVNNFSFNIIPPGCPQDPDFKDSIYCAINEMRPAEPNADLGLCGSAKTLGVAYEGICRRELPDRKATICGKGRP